MATPKRKPKTKPKQKRKPAQKAKSIKKVKPAAKKQKVAEIVTRAKSVVGWASLLMGIPFILMLVFFQTPTQSPPKSNTISHIQAVSESDVFTEFYLEAVPLKIEKRMAFWSDKLWKNTKFLTKLQQFGFPQISDDAPIIPEKFDCTTYVETIAALARSNSINDFYNNLVAIRYNKSQTSFESRNHFPEADWLPNNQSAGIVADITAQVAQTANVQTNIESKLIDKKVWYAQQSKGVKREIASSYSSAWAKPVEAKVLYIPSDQIPNMVKYIPDGTILNVVRKNSPNHPVIISHQGVVVHYGNEVYLRHANPKGRIKDVPVAKYLRAFANTSRWRVLGVNLLELKDKAS